MKDDLKLKKVDQALIYSGLSVLAVILVLLLSGCETSSEPTDLKHYSATTFIEGLVLR